MHGVQGAPAPSGGQSSGGASSASWLAFAGGCAIGAAAAAGGAYALVSHYLRSAADRGAQDQDGQQPRPSASRRPRSQPGTRHQSQQRHPAPASAAAAPAGHAPRLSMPRPQRGSSPLRQQRLNGAWQEQQQHSQVPGSPRVEWLAREDVDPGEVPSDVGPSSVPEQWRRGWRSSGAAGARPTSSGGGGGGGSGGGGGAGVTGGAGGGGAAAAPAVAPEAGASIQRYGSRELAMQAAPPRAAAPAPSPAPAPAPAPAPSQALAAEALKLAALYTPGAGAAAAAPGGAVTPRAKLAIAATADKLADTGKAIEAAAVLYDDYCRVIAPENLPTEESEEVCAMLLQCMELRKKWLFAPAVAPEQRRHEPEAASPSDLDPEPFKWRPLPRSPHRFAMAGGIVHVWADAEAEQPLWQVPGSASEFFTDMNTMLRYSSLGPVKSFCHQRLMLLEQKFNLHVMLNADKEFLAQKVAPHRDFYNVRKVDTHIHHSACMHQKHLLRFIKSKLRKEPDEVVIFRDGKYMTLREVFESLKLTGYDLNVDTLDMHVDKNTFHRFDKFNLKYNPCGQSRLREIFIKQDNLIHGRFLAELTKEFFNDLEASKYQHAELRISVYGRKPVEWDILASWVVANNLCSDNVVWLIQIPRLYNLYRDQGIIDNFEQMLENIFVPLFEATIDPASHPQLHTILSQVVGFDMVDDESRPERRPTKHSPPPAEWTSKHNAAFSYYAYYIYANLYTLNKLRESRGLNTFTFRPHAGEAGDIDHLVSAFMLADNIAHGIGLRKSPPLQYLYYLAQVGLCMSPLSNNSLFLDYHKNPFPAFFARGLSVSLSTDDPLQIHLTKEPLVEEYSVAAQVWKLSATDLCEIARNGVLHSGFPHACKKHWVAEEYWRPGPDGNDIQKTNVPNLRMRFRLDSYQDETRLVLGGALSHQARRAAAIAARGDY